MHIFIKEWDCLHFSQSPLVRMVKEVCFGMAFNSLQLNILCVPPNSVHIYLYKKTDFLFPLYQRLPALSL